MNGFYLPNQKKGVMARFDPRGDWEVFGPGTSGQVVQYNSSLVPGPATLAAASITAITTLLSGTFAIDATGLKTVTTAHGLSVTPSIQDVQATVTKDTNVTDWAFNLLIVDSVDATNVVVKLNVSTASATVGAAAKLGILVITGV